MSQVPLLLGARPLKGLKSSTIPISIGKWRVYGNHKDSKIVVIVDALPYSLSRFELDNAQIELEVIEFGNIHCEIFEQGTEKHLSIHLERM